MNKKMVSVCLVWIVLLAGYQIMLSGHLISCGEELQSLEQALDQQGKVQEQTVVAIAQKQSLDKLQLFAKQNKYLSQPKTQTISAQLPVAYRGDH
jgi:hypothetical protein